MTPRCPLARRAAQIFDGNSFLFTALGSGLWPVMVLVSEIVQTFILGDFCYYYVLSFAQGGSVRLPGNARGVSARRPASGNVRRLTWLDPQLVSAQVVRLPSGIV